MSNRQLGGSNGCQASGFLIAWKTEKPDWYQCLMNVGHLCPGTLEVASEGPFGRRFLTMGETRRHRKGWNPCVVLPGSQDVVVGTEIQEYGVDSRE